MKLGNRFVSGNTGAPQLVFSFKCRKDNKKYQTHYTILFYCTIVCSVSGYNLSLTRDRDIGDLESLQFPILKCACITHIYFPLESLPVAKNCIEIY